MLDIFDVSCNQVIHSDNVETFFDEAVGQVAAEKTGRAGD